ncbi:hypothetical protein A8B84_14820 [Marinobacter sp. EhC06]|uniref:hypothetical protein n=1 Tax=Marinobacter TaxID=2742 RepID=UPI0007D91991|nr:MULTISPECIES: hypothetical protein [unclassified Marinobacter]OAN87466.1 hypothetical protein A8B80_09525 [Marinobacter sp. EhN04]OAN87639.1 hypothetical protein A8B84_14820 [Marinobacter sp. EhC06]
MSLTFFVFLLMGLIATVVFVLGYYRGVTGAVTDHQNSDNAAPIPDEENSNYGLAIVCAVIASAVIIASVGFVPEMMYAGPLLAIVTATMNGVAFFKDPQAQ